MNPATRGQMIIQLKNTKRSSRLHRAESAVSGRSILASSRIRPVWKSTQPLRWCSWLFLVPLDLHRSRLDTERGEVMSFEPQASRLRLPIFGRRISVCLMGGAGSPSVFDLTVNPW